MSALTNDQIIEISKHVELIDIDKGFKVSDYSGFNCGEDEYNKFLLEYAENLNQLNITKTHLLIEKESRDLIGYISLCSDAIIISQKEKSESHLEQVTFKSIPALKVGKLAVSKDDKYKSKGYGAFLLYLAETMAYKINKNGVACRFLTVDADVTNGKDTTRYYSKYGFVKNKSRDYQKRTRCISMRKDIFSEENIDSEEMVSNE